MQKKASQKISELRQDLVSGDWVVIATARGKRPHNFSGEPASFSISQSECPFEDPLNAGEQTPLLLYNYEDLKKGWAVVVIPNKFPAFTPFAGKFKFKKDGPHQWLPGEGFHELFIARDHTRHIPELTQEEATALVRSYRERYQAVSAKKHIAYALIFHNHGRSAGASLGHLHSQLIAMPVVPQRIAESLRGSDRYFREKGKCVHCDMIKYERRAKKRLIEENDEFVALVPFASEIAFEVRIYPKQHQFSFGQLGDKDIAGVAQMLKRVLGKIKKGLNDPAYNFYIHTAPVGDNHHHYHWHIEILPKTSVWAGFELGTGIEISSITPEDAAKFLRSV